MGGADARRADGRHVAGGLPCQQQTLAAFSQANLDVALGALGRQLDDPARMVVTPGHYSSGRPGPLLKLPMMPGHGPLSRSLGRSSRHRGPAGVGTPPWRALVIEAGPEWDREEGSLRVA